MKAEQLQVIKERAEKATNGPWKVVKSEESGVQIGTTWESGQLKACVPVVTTAHGKGSVTVYINDRNAEFVAHAREDVPALIAEIERLQASLELTEKCYEICERGMFKANDMFIETKNKLDQVELAEAKMRMENERLREVLKQVLEDEAPNCDGYETFIHATARKALEVRP
ncbi:hypothetical protein AAGS61_01620 [Lysinibacillus sp. KU-BSD001]|uniref:hypothetical protein n=1 Tax=Lysinibacillus sp. KU-BSD001 TaxID=3141328 RepID=UPI0036E1B3EA